MAGTLVYTEVTPEGAHPAALELLTKARALGGEVAAVALGPGATAAAEELGQRAHRVGVQMRDLPEIFGAGDREVDVAVDVVRRTRVVEPRDQIDDRAH